jgi:hypothetical protein
MLSSMRTISGGSATIVRRPSTSLVGLSKACSLLRRLALASTASFHLRWSLP